MVGRYSAYLWHPEKRIRNAHVPAIVVLIGELGKRRGGFIVIFIIVVGTIMAFLTKIVGEASGY